MMTFPQITASEESFHFFRNLLLHVYTNTVMSCYTSLTCICDLQRLSIEYCTYCRKLYILFSNPTCTYITETFFFSLWTHTQINVFIRCLLLLLMLCRIRVQMMLMWFIPAGHAHFLHHVMAVHSRTGLWPLGWNESWFNGCSETWAVINIIQIILTCVKSDCLLEVLDSTATACDVLLTQQNTHTRILFNQQIITLLN